jgi:hypothetical protein
MDFPKVFLVFFAQLGGKYGMSLKNSYKALVKERPIEIAKFTNQIYVDKKHRVVNALA